MIIVEIFSKEECHLCGVAKEAIKKVQQSHPFELREILIREGDAYYEQYKERIPVIHINNKFAFQYRVNEKDFLLRLQSESESAS
ncbi:MAG: glutaredoxin family protein [Bacteroidetes bacterium]|nr:MAG: glutaredoxin family protein [Bacteroidota bacterium]